MSDTPLRVASLREIAEELARRQEAAGETPTARRVVREVSTIVGRVKGIERRDAQRVALGEQPHPVRGGRR